MLKKSAVILGLMASAFAAAPLVSTHFVDDATVVRTKTVSNVVPPVAPARKVSTSGSVIDLINPKRMIRARSFAASCSPKEWGMYLHGSRKAGRKYAAKFKYGARC
jgi:hypothetical protein